MNKQISYFTVSILMLLLFYACASGGGGKNSDSKTTTGESVGQDTVQITVNSDDMMQFDIDKIIVPENKVIVLTLHHVGTLPRSSMGHNLVIVDQGVSLSDFAKKAFAAKENDYIPQSEMHNIIAYTGLLGGGESDTITFNAPEKGSYEFVCSFPGHHSIMKGKFIVE